MPEFKVGEVTLEVYIADMVRKHRDDEKLPEMIGESMNIISQKIAETGAMIVTDNAALLMMFRDFVKAWRSCIDERTIPVALLSRLDKFEGEIMKPHPGDQILAVLTQLGLYNTENVQSSIDDGPSPSKSIH